MASVITENISKTYGREKRIAVDKVSFSVEKGELFGLIGPDGAGKSSIFRMLTTLLLPDGGQASVDGFDVVRDYKEIRKRVGYMPGRFSLYQDLSVEENLNFFAAVFGTTVKENYHLVKDIYEQLAPFKDRRAGKLSGGMKQKLALCCALIHKPSVLFLDEPTTGVDPVSRKEFWEMLKRLKEQGITILVSTPYMDEANRCDRIALMQNGKVLSVNTPTAITASYPGKLWSVKAADMYKLQLDLKKNESVSGCFSFGETLHVNLKNETDSSMAELQNYLESQGNKNLQIQEIKPDIEDCFINLLSHSHGRNSHQNG